jgi:hypothetical protein
VSPDKARVRWRSRRSATYKDGDFPSEIREAEYRRRMGLSYPIHGAVRPAQGLVDLDASSAPVVSFVATMISVVAAVTRTC